jgi:hypothetical protein
MGQPVTSTRGRVLLSVGISVFYALLELFDDLFKRFFDVPSRRGLCEPGDVVELLPAYYSRFHLGELQYPLNEPVLLVGVADLGLYLFVSDFPVECLFKKRLELPDHRGPVGMRFLLVGKLREIHHVRRFPVGDKFEHFLLAVTGGFRYYRIRNRIKGAGVSDDEAVARFDERAEISRKHRFGGLNGVVGEGAEDRGNKVHGPQQFKRRIPAIQSGDLFSLFAL